MLTGSEARKKRGKYRFPWRGGNRFELLVDGRTFFSAMVESILAARSYVLLEMYLFESGQVADRFIDALIVARSRGVRVYLLLDAFGSLYLRRRDRLQLLSAGVHLAYYNPLEMLRWHRNLFRNHRKLLLVDGLVAYTGGAGITDQFDPDIEPDRYWYEIMVAIHGPCVADWQELFVESWARWAKVAPEGVEPVAPEARIDGEFGRVVVHGHVVSSSEIMRSYLRHIARGRTNVWLATAYFVPPWKLRRALRRAARRGIDVRLLLPGPHSDHPGLRHMGSRYYERLLRNGVRIFEYQPRFIHAKVLLCDRWLSIGSSNADRWNYRWNLEANQELRDTSLSEQVQKLFEEDFSHCTEFDYEHWRVRSRFWRLREWFWGKVVALLAWFSDQKKYRRGPRDD